MPCLAVSLGQQKWILSIRLKLGGEIILIHYLLLFHPHSCNTQVAKTLSGRNYIYFCLQPFTSEAGADITINVYPLTRDRGKWKRGPAVTISTASGGD